MRFRVAALPAAALAATVAVLALPAPASAAEPGVDVSITELPGTLAAADGARTVTVVASADSGRCRKVRWSMLLSVDGIGLDQVSVNRVEEDGSFPVSIRAGGGTARITDLAPDPGRLCRDRTVTARYRIAVDGDRAGEVRYQAQAFDVAGRLLQEAGGRSEVVGADPAPEPSRTADPEPSAEPEPEPSASAPAAAVPDDEAGETPAAAPTAPLSTERTASGGDFPSLFGPGLVVGALLVFLGVGLLVRLRGRAGDRPPVTRRRRLPPHLYARQM